LITDEAIKNRWEIVNNRRSDHEKPFEVGELVVLLGEIDGGCLKEAWNPQVVMLVVGVESLFEAFVESLEEVGKPSGSRRAFRKPKSF
jgi:hypothetical protein